MSALARFWSDRRGHTAIEYAMIIGVGAIAIVTALMQMGSSVTSMFDGLMAAWKT